MDLFHLISSEKSAVKYAIPTFESPIAVAYISGNGSSKRTGIFYCTPVSNIEFVTYYI